MRLLPQLSGLKSLGLINCKQLFMSGTFLNNPAERESFEDAFQSGKVKDQKLKYVLSLSGLESLQLDHNTYLSDLLLLRICSGLRNVKQLRYGTV